MLMAVVKQWGKECLTVNNSWAGIRGPGSGTQAHHVICMSSRSTQPRLVLSTSQTESALVSVTFNHPPLAGGWSLCVVCWFCRGRERHRHSSSFMGDRGGSRGWLPGTCPGWPLCKWHTITIIATTASPSSSSESHPSTKITLFWTVWTDFGVWRTSGEGEGDGGGDDGDDNGEGVEEVERETQIERGLRKSHHGRLQVKDVSAAADGRIGGDGHGWDLGRTEVLKSHYF